MDSEHPTARVPHLVSRLYAIVAELQAHFPGRPFTLDGHLVGSIGEVLGAHRYGLELLPCSAPDHDARAADGTLVQIKTTQGRAVGMRAECQHLIVLRLLADGTAEEVFNGPGRLAWAAAGRMQRNGQRVIGVGKLRELMQEVSSGSSLPAVAG